MSLVNKLKLNMINIPGFRTKRKIVVFESDDWGTIRVSSKEAHKKLVKQGYKLDKCIYGSNDMLESNNDLDRLFNLLSSYNDMKGNYAKFTLNNIVANPDFEKIAESNYEKYYYEPFTTTLKKYPQHDAVINKYKKALKEKIIKPQFHGREHIHINNWMNALRKNEKMTIDAFNSEMFTIFRGKNSTCKKEFLDAFSTNTVDELKKIGVILSEGTKLFENIWGFKSETVIAPCYSWNSAIEKYFKDFGIKTIQSGRVQTSMSTETQKKYFIRRYTGQKNNLGMNYTIRNVIFEPSANPNHNWVNSSMKEIETSFFWGKPAVVTSHRVNYIGGLNEKNATNGLNMLEVLLKTILKKYPDVEFLSSDELSELILKN